MPSAEFDDASALWDWAEPLIHDVLREAYEVAFPPDAAREVALAHASLWRTLATGASDTAVVDRLERALAGVEDGFAAFNDANANVVSELAETVRRRYRISQRSRETYERVLASIGRGLAVGAP